MSANTAKQFIGYVIGKKTGGTSGGIPVGTEVFIPITASRPRDPENNVYAPVVNSSAFPTVKILGKRTPSLGISTLLKPSWMTTPLVGSSYTAAALFTSWISSFDANNDADTWAWLLNDGTLGGGWSNRVFDGCKGVTMSLAQSAQGGGIGLDLNFIAQSAQGSTSFTGTPPAPDAGNVLDVSQVDYGDTFTIGGIGNTNATADLVRGWRANLIRGGAYDLFFNGTLYPAASSSGMLGGTAQIEQSPLYVKTWGSSGKIRLGPSGSPILTLTPLLSHDEDVYDISAGFGDVFRTYTFIDTTAGQNPCPFS